MKQRTINMKHFYLIYNNECNTPVPCDMKHRKLNMWYEFWVQTEMGKKRKFWVCWDYNCLKYITTVMK